ncbi:EAL domain-containing protein [Lysobacter sp. KIS68-7]|uniref:sensor domain-containing diguanylate cyclase n=1 Tax=Lysobacter sp. KIS68-7 TaxID=2904252 RepID=UPI001E3EF368|nr:EAL domain-containing protein [Lysobacter sp. KIS68-7]UHQ20164.1 EAL domain-containing protein [Lysobacter sp. KIS68-7]
MTAKFGGSVSTLPGEDAVLAGALLRARSPAEAVAAWFEAHPHWQARGACVLWSTRWPRDIATWPEGVADARILAEANIALAHHRVGGDDVHPRVLHDDGESVVAIVHCPGDDAPHPAVGVRLAELLDRQRMEESVSRLEQAEKLQRSLYAIADMAGSDLDMPDMLRGLHRIVSDLMYAENFYIAMHDRERDTLRFLYFADVVDEELNLTAGMEIPLARIEQGLTWYLTRDKRPLMGVTEELREQVSGPLQIHGADSSDWLGVPMLRDGEVKGVVVVQSYTGERCYTTAEMSLLAFVAEHILTALERKRGRAELEQHVVERTQQLQVANQSLRHEIAERKRSERLQAALYRIAALASLDESSESFYRHVHTIVGELIDAKNFYIALLSEDGATVSFPYAADEHEHDWDARTYSRGLTEHVLATQKPQLITRAAAQAMVDAGEADAFIMGAPTQVWLGAPLLSTEGAIGVVAVQSYEDTNAYTERDAELLTFVSYQIGSSLQRRRAAELLRQANAELEHRVEARTLELREQIAVREQIEAQLQHQVMHDVLTGLPNRIYLRDRIERAVAGLRREGGHGFGLLYIDVDRFKVVNDSLGHSAGDVLLKQVAERLAACVREPDVVARLAGDEFILLLEHVQQPETASKVAQRVLRALQPAVSVAGRELQLSCSIGIAIAMPGRYANADAVLHDADVALYRAKEAGRNRFVLFDDAMHQSAMDVLDLEQALRDALLHDEFEPWFQPIVQLHDEAVVGYEALLRWHHPQRGVLNPGAFLKVAEDSGLIGAIDWRMFRLALESGRLLVDEGRYLTLNVSPRLFQHEDFAGRLLDLVGEIGFPADALRLEVTEGTLLGDPETVVRTLHRLREAGVEAALDDFGTGYSSLGHVHRFPLRMIKIDQSFVAPFAHGTAPRSSALVEAILALGNALGVEIVAEGIESEAQSAVLRSMGCLYGQGYHFARPQPAGHWLGQTNPGS